MGKIPLVVGVVCVGLLAVLHVSSTEPTTPASALTDGPPAPLVDNPRAIAIQVTAILRGHRTLDWSGRRAHLRLLEMHPLHDRAHLPFDLGLPGSPSADPSIPALQDLSQPDDDEAACPAPGYDVPLIRVVAQDADSVTLLVRAYPDRQHRLLELVRSRQPLVFGRSSACAPPDLREGDVSPRPACPDHDGERTR